MTLPKKCWITFLVILIVVPGLRAQSGSTRSLLKTEKPAPAAATATAEDVQALRETVSAQQKEIDQLKSAMQRLLEATQQATAAPVPGNGQLALTGAATPAGAPGATIAASQAKAAQEQKPGAGLLAGWNGDHFFVSNSDGSFKLEPYGYLQLDNRNYIGTPAGAPPNTFVFRRARFGFQANMGKHYQFVMLGEFADFPNTRDIRDFYLNVNIRPEVQFRVGQYKEPFSQDELQSVLYNDFVEKALVNVLAPTFNPGLMVHGAFMDGRVQYQLGAFNGKGILNRNDTSTPETVFRLRFYPFKESDNEWLKGLAIGGAGARGHALSAVFGGTVSPAPAPGAGRSFSGALATGTFTFFNNDAINGGVTRANGEMTWVKGPWAVRAEYVQTNENRTLLGPGGTNAPGVVAKGYYASATYLLTGEDHPENGPVVPSRPFLEKEGWGLGAWELKFRYNNLQMEDGPQGTAANRNRVDQIQTGINWYPSKFVRYMLDFNVERLKNPIGALTAPQTFVSVLQRVQLRF